MKIEDYKMWSQKILDAPTIRQSYLLYLGLLEIFVQDCYTFHETKYYGNETKQKARILFNLQEKMLSTRELDAKHLHIY